MVSNLIKNNKTDIFLMCLFLFLILWSGNYLFFETLELKKQDKNTLPFIAHFEVKENYVVKKSEFSIAWTDIKKNDGLIENDHIFTDKDASAIIKFKDGAKINIAENTLFIIKKKNNQSIINFKKGLLYAEITKEQSLSFMMKNKLVQIKSSDAKLQLNLSQKNDQIIVLKGSASVDSQGKRLEIKENQVYSMKNKAATVEDLSSNLTHPIPKAQIWQKKLSQVNFTWKVLNSPKVAFFIIAKDPEFKQVLAKIKAHENVNYSPSSFGRLYWKVITMDHQNKSFDGETRSLTLLEDRAPIVYAPRKNHSFKTPNTVSSEALFPIYLKWDKQKEETYQWRMYLENKIIQEGEQSKTRLLFKARKAGKYTFQVKALSSERGSSDWSIPRAFNIITNKKSPIQLTSLVTNLLPLHNQEVILNSPNDTITFEWKQENKSKTFSYKIEIANDKHFSKRRTFTKIDQTSFTWSPPKLGVYYWRVKSNKYISPIMKLKLNKPTPPPTPSVDTLDIEIILPEVETTQKATWVDFIFPTAYAEAPTIPIVKIKWKKIKNAQFYIFQAYKDEKMKHKLFEKKLESSNFDWHSPQVGKYWFRIAVVDGWSQQSPFSTLKPISIKSKWQMEITAPQLITPNHKQNVKWSSDLKYMFTWKSDKQENQSFTIQFSPDLSFKEILYEKRTKSSQVLVPLDFIKKELHVYWRVLISGPKKITRKSKRRLLTFTHALTPPPVAEVKNIKTKKSLPQEKYNYFSIGVKPRKATYSLNNDNIKINSQGSVLGTLSVSSYHLFNKVWATKFDIEYASATLVNDYTYTETSFLLQSSYQKKFEQIIFNFNSGVSLNKMTLIKSTSANDINTSELTLSAVHLGVILKLNKKLHSHLFELNIGFGNINKTMFQYLWERKARKHYAWYLGLGLINIKTKNDQEQISSEQQFISTGLKYAY